MERKVIKRLSNTSYWSDGVGLWLKPNVGGEFREKDVAVRDGRKWHRDVGVLDSYFKEAVSDIPEIQFVRKVATEVVKEVIIEEKPVVEPKVKNGSVGRPRCELSSEDIARGEAMLEMGVSVSVMCRKMGIYRVKWYRAVSGMKKAPTS